MEYMRRFILIALLLGIMPLKADVEHVVVKWSPQLCKSTCTKQLHDLFSKLPGVANLTIDEGNGVMELNWKEKAPFSYTNLDWTMRKIGLYMTYVRVKATGNIVKVNKTYYLDSEHDRTRFNLLGMAIPQSGVLAVQTNSIFNRPLSQDNIELLEEAMKNKLLVTIDGPLFEPWRSPPLWLVMEQAVVAQPKAKKPTQK
jgi:hypothetical protein